MSDDFGLFLKLLTSGPPGERVLLGSSELAIAERFTSLNISQASSHPDGRFDSPNEFICAHNDLHIKAAIIFERQ